MAPEHIAEEGIRIVLAEDNDDLRVVMQSLINEAPGLRCVASTAVLNEVGPLVRQHRAQIAVVDIHLRGGSALKCLPALCGECPSTRFVIHSGHSNPELIRSAHDAGASAYVLKSGDIDELIAAIRGLTQDECNGRLQAT